MNKQMSRRDVVVKGAAFAQVADAVLAAEDASDANLAAAGALLTAAVSRRAAAGVPAPVAQRVIDDLERMVVAQFASRKALLSAHGTLNAIAKTSMAGEGYPWGPDSGCPYASATEEATGLRAVA